jgi:hypothetical protein
MACKGGAPDRFLLSATSERGLAHYRARRCCARHNTRYELDSFVRQMEILESARRVDQRFSSGEDSRIFVIPS